MNYVFDKVQLAADNLATCASYEPTSDDEMEHGEATLTANVSADREQTRAHCSS